MVTGGASAVSSRRVELVFASVEFMTIMISRRIAAIITLAKIKFPFHDSIMKVDRSYFECRLVYEATNNSNKLFKTTHDPPESSRLLRVQMKAPQLQKKKTRNKDCEKL